MLKRRKVVYKITFPNGKIYIGKDLTDTCTYFGSMMPQLIASDFSQSELDDLNINKRVLWSSETATDSEVNAEEVRQIRHHRSNDPSVGYNRWPKWNGRADVAPVCSLHHQHEEGQ